MMQCVCVGSVCGIKSDVISVMNIVYQMALALKEVLDCLLLVSKLGRLLIPSNNYKPRTTCLGCVKHDPLQGS